MQISATGTIHLHAKMLGATIFFLEMMRTGIKGYVLL